jgi:thiamine-monophosphate kinase
VGPRRLYGSDNGLDISEDALLAAVRKVLSGADPQVRVGPGDDAAVVAPGSGELLLSTDALIEGVHFTRGTTTARDLGAKAIAVNVSDIAAMAGSPRYALCALTLTDDVDAAWVMELFGGMREACDGYALWLVGGNLARGTELAIVITVVGEVAPGRAVLRSGARVGDLVAVTGDLGGAAAGLRSSGAAAATALGDVERAAVARHVRPTARVGEAAVLARRGATSMIDVSDGLARDLSRICDASGVGVRLRVDDLPLGPAATRQDAIGGGEDYELVVTLPDGDAFAAAASELADAFGVPLTAVGEIVAEERIAVEAGGRESVLAAQGWDHFA